MAVETTIGRKYERDIDLLLAEEFAVSPEFASWFLGQTRFAGADVGVLYVFVSLSDVTGESDLVVVFQQIGGERRVALHIEDKIDAPLQPQQEARYRLRGESAVSRNEYDEFLVVLCSPEGYRDSHPETSSFDSFVSYESIGEYLAGCGDERSQYRSTFITSAASRSGNTWTKIDDPATKAFWDAAYEIAQRDFPLLEMKPLDLTKDSTWITFRPQDMPTKPHWIYVALKGEQGQIDLTFTRVPLRVLAPVVEPLLEPGMTVHQTGKSAAIRIQVDGFRVSEPAEAELPKVREAFVACERLIRFYREHRERLEEAAASSYLVGE